MKARWGSRGRASTGAAPVAPWVLAAFLLVGSGTRAQDPGQRARAALEAGRFLEAQNLYEEALRSERNHDNLLGLAEALFRQHETDRSYGYFIEARKLDPKDPEAAAGVARVAEAKGRNELESDPPRPLARASLGDAVILWREAAELMPDPYAARLRIADILMLLDRPAEAVGELEKALQARPGDPRAGELLVSAHYLSGRYADFLLAVEPLIAARPDAVHLRLRKLEVLARMRRYPEARGLFEAIMGTAGSEAGTELPDFETQRAAIRALDLAWVADADRKVYRETLTAFVAKRPESLLGQYHLAFEKGVQGDFKGAADGFRKCLEIQPDEPWSRAKLAMSLMESGDRSQCQAEIRQGLEATPGHEALLEAAGRLVEKDIELRDFDQALAVHDLILAARPEDPDARRNHAVLLRDKGLIEAAIVELEPLAGQAELDDEKRAGYLNDLALFLQGCGRLKEAEARFRESIDLWAWQTDAAENLGVQCFDQGRWQDAADAFGLARETLGGAKSAEARKRERTAYYLRQLELRGVRPRIASK